MRRRIMMILAGIYGAGQIEAYNTFFGIVKFFSNLKIRGHSLTGILIRIFSMGDFAQFNAG